jgi:DNA end-binding protein Ku
MARAIWSGSITFGLVNAPVRMFSAVREEDLRFHLVHEPDGGRIGYAKVCKAEETPVPDDEIIRAYEYAEDDLVPVTDDDFAAAEGEALRQIEVVDFVPYDQIDPIHFERAYYLGPEEGAERVYALLARAMDESGLAAIGRFVFHRKEHLGALRVRDRVITLERMFFADEVLPHEELAPDGRTARVDKEELKSARQLIGAMAGDFEPERYHDRYRERLLDIIKRKRKGETIQAAPAAEDEEPVDLMAALKASLEAAKGGRAPSGGDGELTVEQLRERAREAGIAGRSKMTKDELRKALKAA